MEEAKERRRVQGGRKVKLNLHPKEFLSLYSLLEQQIRDEFDTPTDPSLKEIYNRMRSYLISTLGRRDDGLVEDSFDVWEREQKAKIADLESQNEKLMMSIVDRNFLAPEEAAAVPPKRDKHKRFKR